MSQRRKSRAEQIQESIRDVLLHQWDPIGVQDILAAQDEYDGYIGGVYRLLVSGATEDQLVEHLWHIQTITIGLSSTDKAALRPVAQRLRALNVKL